MAVEAGREAPDFTLRNADGEEVALSSFRGRSNVVLVFYPAAFSDVCTAQFTRIRAGLARFSEECAQVLGVSVDSIYSQGRFAEDLGLTDVMLLADFEPKGAVSRAYGVYLEAYGVAGRATFVIDRSGIVRGVSRTENPGQLPDEEEYFAALAACTA